MDKALPYQIKAAYVIGVQLIMTKQKSFPMASWTEFVVSLAVRSQFDAIPHEDR